MGNKLNILIINRPGVARAVLKSPWSFIDLLIYSFGHYFHRIRPLGQFGLAITVSVCLCVIPLSLFFCMDRVCISVWTESVFWFNPTQSPPTHPVLGVTIRIAREIRCHPYAGFVKISSSNLHSITAKARERKFGEKVHLPLPVMRQVSHVMCHMSPVTCQMYHFKKIYIYFVTVVKVVS